jgi:hypothetical protein
MKVPIAFALACVLLPATAASADELKLKDGTKITGKIVGFEGESFKVETSYGFALVRRDKVVSIRIDDEAKAETAKSEPAKSANAPAEPSRPAPGSGTVTANAAPAARPAEPVIRESVEGTAYVNHTFGFRMYKPPSWRVIEGARRLLPSAIVAMGTNDETTLLVLGQGRLTGSLDSHAAATDRQLRQVYENLRVLSDQRAVIGGVPAIERRFRGTVGERDWSCVMVTFSRGADVFTILGMTAADSDLVQIQENVIARTLASLEFERP